MQKSRLRNILMILSFLAVASTVAGGSYYYFSLKEHELGTAQRQAMATAENVRGQIEAHLAETVKTTRALAGLKELPQALELGSPDKLELANQVLDHFKASLGVDVCYLMNRLGEVVATSNRGDPDSFLGYNFSFRPYFKTAVKGEPGRYFALGTVSKKRGAYFSYPVYGKSKDRILGVAVIKTSISLVEDRLQTDGSGVLLVVGPHDVVFCASSKDWLYKTLWRKTEEQKQKLAQSKQYGSGPWYWTGLAPDGENRVKDLAGREYIFFVRNIPNNPGWRVAHLRNLREISQIMLGPLVRTSGIWVIGLSLLAALAILYLNRQAKGEIGRREQAELELRQAQEQLSQYSKELERKVRRRTQEITSFLEYTPAVAYMKDREGNYIMVNSRWEEIFGHGRDFAIGRTQHEVFEPHIADQFRNNDLKVLHSGKPYQVEEDFPVGDAMRTYLSVRFPVFTQTGKVTRLCGISVDITELKKAQEQLRRLSGSIMASQEKERNAIARELHDELGQMLTALRMEAVWLRERLQHQEPKAKRRAARMCELIDQTISDVRHIATRLRPPVLDDLGLVDALEWFTRDFEERTKIACVYTHFKVPVLDGFPALAAYRVAQEALTNVARHSKATGVEVTLSVESRRLTLVIKDNGIGFDLEQMTGNQTLGIAGMRERAALSGGELTIQSQKGQGTEVKMVLPLMQAGGLV
jgi:PAS domain S-box-containing protein